jgi:hypothetical protein
MAVLDPRIKDIDIREGTSSYTEDKSIIYLCLRDESGKFYNTNTIIYCFLHEYSHLLNRVDYGHTEAFYKIFNRLLCKAAALGIYDPKAPHEAVYCGVSLRGLSMPTCNIEDLHTPIEAL